MCDVALNRCSEMDVGYMEAYRCQQWEEAERTVNHATHRHIKAARSVAGEKLH